MMNPFRGHQIETDPTHLSRERSSDQDYHRYSRDPGQDKSSIGADVGWDKPSPSFLTWHNEEKHYDDEDPDGQPYEPDEEDDPELARKRKELQVIEERIMLKRASIALKNFDFKTILPISGSEESNKTSEILRDRVNRILQLRHPHGYGPKGPLVKKRKRSSLSLQDDHPLKQRVKSVLQQRFEDHSTKAERYEQIPFLCSSPPSPPCQKHTSPLKDESSADQGFMRFLNILNKGVDIDQLSKIVNDDCEAPSASNASPHSSHENGDQFDLSLSVSSPSMETKEEEERLNTDEQQKHLQNVLESLGLSLGMDEMNRLADRTQERLYGRRQCTKEATEEEKLEENKSEEDNTIEKEVQPQDGREKYSPGHYTRSSSSSSSSLSASRKRSRSRSYRSPKSKSYRSRSRSPKSRLSRSPRSFRSRSPKYRSFKSRSRSPRSRSFKSRSRSPRSRSFRSRSRPYSRSPRPHQRQRSRQNHRDSYLEYQTFPPSHPAYSYDYSSSTSQHHQMYPPSQAEAYSALYNSYLQYASYYNYQSDLSNYWAHNHPSVFASNNINVPLTSVNQHNSLHGKPPVATTNEIPSLKEIPFSSRGMYYLHKERTWKERTQEEIQQRKAYNKYVNQEKEFNRKKEKELQAIISLIRNPNQHEKEKKKKKVKNKQASSNAQASQAQASGQTASNAVPKKKYKKKKKVRVFVEDADRPERMEGPLTRCFVAKNPEKFSEFDRKLVEIEDVFVPPFIPLPSQQVVTDSRQNRRKMCRRRTHLVNLLSRQTSRIGGGTSEQKKTGEQQEGQVKQEPEEKPELTNEEIKANLKKKLEEFNNRIKQPFKSPANSLMPQTNVEDEI